MHSLSSSMSDSSPSADGQQSSLFKKTPLLLLKTRSTPLDGYEEFFTGERVIKKQLGLESRSKGGGESASSSAGIDSDPYSGVQSHYHPVFIPVLEHRFHKENLNKLKDIFLAGGFDLDSEADGASASQGQVQKYGGLIFTSQRAVEAFGKVLEEADDSLRKIIYSSSYSLILYTVGPATSRSLKATRDTFLPHAQVHGEEAGNGEALAHMILDHYHKHLAATATRNVHANIIRVNSTTTAVTTSAVAATQTKQKPALLFLVGEQRRDIIPKTLMSESLKSEDRQIKVDELVVYETGEMASFENDFRIAIAAGENYCENLRRHCQSATPPGDLVLAEEEKEKDNDDQIMWVVVFSPTGCDAMLRVLGRNPSASPSSAPAATTSQEATNLRRTTSRRSRCFIATIGPTTRDHLRSKYGVDPEVCAEKPTPEGVGMGIATFMKRRQI